MHKNLKIATFFAVVFVVIVFSSKYFSTTIKSFVSYQNYSQELQKSLEENALMEELNKKEEQDLIDVHEQNFVSELEAFDYNRPVADIDEKALKKEYSKKFDYNNYEDRVRMEEPEYLDENGLYVTLMQAVADNDIKRAKIVIARGASLNSPDGNTSFAPIFWALSNGNVDMVKLLISKGAKLNTPDERGFFPIHWAVEHSSSRPNSYQTKAIFDILLDAYPEEINRQDYVLKMTPIMQTVNLRNRKLFSYLLDRGANLTLLNSDKKDVFDAVLKTDCHGCMHLLNKKKTENETTPLINFASSVTVPSVWLPPSTIKKVVKKTKPKRDPNAIVIEGSNLAIPVYKKMPDILPLDNSGSEPNMVIRGK